MVPPKILKGAICKRWCRPRTTMPCIRDLLSYIKCTPKALPFGVGLETFHCRCLVLICSVHEIEFRVWFVITIDAGAGLQASHCFALAEGVCLFRASSPQQTLLMALERKRERESEREGEREREERGSEREREREREREERERESERERAREICDLCVCPLKWILYRLYSFFFKTVPQKKSDPTFNFNWRKL